MGKDRRIGHDFARIGLPKKYFGPVLETLRSTNPHILDNVSVTMGYYWLNASWGVTSTPGHYRYLVAPGKLGDTEMLSEMLRNLDGKSSLTQSTMAISIAYKGKASGNNVVKDGKECELSVKLHNAMHLEIVDYRSPPQTSAAGFEVTEDLLSMATIFKTQSTATQNLFSSGVQVGRGGGRQRQR